MVVVESRKIYILLANIYSMYSCERCDEEYDSQRALTVHQNNCLDRDRSKQQYECAHCSDTFEDYPSRREFKDSNNYFCSVECKNSFERRGEENSCAYCGGSVYIPPSRLTEMGDYPIENHFCGKECESKWKSENWVGEDHPTYYGWSDENDYGVDWGCIRVDVLERDDYSCQDCGLSNEKHVEEYGMCLHIHHKKPLREFENATEANKMNNLITYCVSCQ